MRGPVDRRGDDHDVEAAVVESRARSDDRAVAVLASVGNGDEQRPTSWSIDAGVVMVSRSGWIAGQLAHRDHHVAREAAPLETIRGEAMRDPRVEPDAGDVEEQAAVDLACIDRPRRAADRRRRTRPRTSNGIPSSRARPLPDPLGHERDGGLRERDARCRPRSSSRRRPTRRSSRRHGQRAARASSRAWPDALGDEDVRRIASARGENSAAACAARARATSMRPPVPEIGLMMTASSHGR